MQKVCIIGMY